MLQMAQYPAMGESFCSCCTVGYRLSSSTTTNAKIARPLHERTYLYTRCGLLLNPPEAIQHRLLPAMLKSLKSESSERCWVCVHASCY
jgi:hypothetical protein